jgi:malate synthase
MAAQIPIKKWREWCCFRKSKKRQRARSENGHDGTVAHPALVAVAMAEFNEHMPTPNQLHVTRDDNHNRTRFGWNT